MASDFQEYLKDKPFATDYRSVTAVAEIPSDEHVASVILSPEVISEISSEELETIVEGPLARYLTAAGLGTAAILGAGQLFPSHDHDAAVASVSQQFDDWERQRQEFRQSSRDFRQSVQDLRDRWRQEREEEREEAQPEETIHYPGQNNQIDDVERLMDTIIGFEGFRSRTYLDSGGTLTIGYGLTRHDIPNLSHGDTITRQDAHSLLQRRLLNHYATVVFDEVEVPITDEQAIALTSFVYNVGQTAFRNSTLLRRLNSGDYEAAAQEFRRWVRSGGRELPGLVTRREYESALFSQGISAVDQLVAQAPS